MAQAFFTAKPAPNVMSDLERVTVGGGLILRFVLNVLARELKFHRFGLRKID